MTSFHPVDLDKIDWLRVLPNLGVHETYLQRPAVSKQCPLHPEQGKTKFRFLRPVERGRWACNDCGFGGPIELLTKLHGWSVKEAFDALREHRVIDSPLRPTVRLDSPESAATRAAKIRKDFDKMRKWWRASTHLNVAETAASRYLRRRIPRVNLERLGDDLRAHPGLSYWEETRNGKFTERGQFPALIGLFRDVAGEVKMMHRIYLTPTGQKAAVESPKKMFTPQWVTGCAIRIGDNPDAPVIGVAEGIEKSAAIYTACGLKMPVYCAGTAHGVATLEVPPHVQRVHIFADNNLPTAQHPNGCGQEAASALAARLRATGVDVIIHVAKTPDGDHEDDWNALVAAPLRAVA